MASAITDEQENGVRLGLLRQKIDHKLCDKVHEKFPRDPVLLYEEFDRLRKEIEKLQRKKIISKIDFNLLLPSNGRCDSSKFDTSLLTKILFNFCGYQRFREEPNKNDRSMDANIYRLNGIRNRIQHNPVSVSDHIYQGILKEAEQPLLALGCSLSQIEKDVANISIIDKKGKKKIEKLEESTKNFSYNVLPPVRNFMGRDAEIDKIHRCLVSAYEDKSCTNPIPGVVLSGISGVGKSELVRQYWLKHHNTYYEGIIMWINAQSVNSITNDFMEIGEGIGLTMKQEDQSYLPIKIIVQKIYNHFVLRKTDEPQRKVLFVFDNLNNPDDIESFLPGMNNAPYILVTSQRKHWSQRFQFIELNVFPRETAEAFLKKNTKDVLQTNQDANEKLLSELGGHPLALQQAATYINMHNMRVESYLTLFQEYYGQLELTSPDIHCKPAVTTILISIENLMQRADSKGAMDLLNVSAYLDGRTIKKGLLLKFKNGNVLELNRALGLLSSYSFVNHQTSQEVSIFEQQILTVHPLIQLALKYDHNKNKQKEKHLQRILKTFFNDLNAEKKTMNKGKYWFNHYVYLFDSKDTKYDLLINSMTEKDIISPLLEMFELKGKLNKVVEILRSILNLQLESAGETHPEVIETRHNIGCSLVRAGKHKEALQIFKQLEKFHPNPLINQHNIAQTLSHLGNYKDALEMYRKVEKGELATLRKNHPDLLMTRHNIAELLARIGKHKEALDIFNSLKKTRGNDNIKFQIEFNTARTLSCIGENKEALKIYRELQKRMLYVLGNDHPTLFKIKHGIAQSLSNIEKYDEALEIYREVEEKELALLGKDHPDLLITQCSISLVLVRTGKCEEGLEILRAVEEKQLAMLEENHPNLLETQLIIQETLLLLGKSSALRK